jgi:hypothetical protein
VKVKKVELKDADISPLDDSTGFASHCSWVVTGSAGHWGHIHQRQNAYEAVLRIEPAEGAWKITGLELQSRQRL